MIKVFKDLIVWQKSIDLVQAVYELTNNFPANEIYCLSSQMKRVAISIPSNIAEGSKRSSSVEYIRYLVIANSSVAELETQIVIARRLYPNNKYNNAESLLIEIQKMLSTVIVKLKNYSQS